MRIRSICLTLLSFSLLFASCLSTGTSHNYSYSSGKEEAIDSYIAENYIKEKNYAKAIDRLLYCLDNGIGVEKHIKIFKTDYPETLPHITVYLKNSVANAKSVSDLKKILAELYRLHLHDLLSDSDHDMLKGNLNHIAQLRNRENTARFLLTDSYKEFSSLNEPENRFIIFKRSVDELAGNPYNKKTLQKETLSCVKSLGKDSQEFRYLKERLSEINFSEEIIRGQMAEVYPDYFKKWMKDREVRLKIYSSDQNDPYLYDIEEELRKKDNISIVEDDGEDVFRLKITNQRFSERYIPERTQTIRYAKYQVNLIGAALLMPKNATYMYDYISGGFEISYSFTLQLIKGGDTIAEQRVSGKANDMYGYCNDARIRNVFGGVSPAQFIANPDMQARCGAEKRNADEEQVFRDVIERVVMAVLDLPPVSSKMAFGSSVQESSKSAGSQYGKSKFKMRTYVEPSSTSGYSISLQEGETVELLGKLNGMVRIKNKSGQYGWVSQNLIEPTD